MTNDVGLEAQDESQRAMAVRVGNDGGCDDCSGDTDIDAIMGEIRKTVVLKVRKKPVEVRAMFWDGTENCASNIRRWAGDKVDFNGEFMTVYTLEGEYECLHPYVIIKGINGEFYPCKPDIFAKTYDIILEVADDQT